MKLYKYRYSKEYAYHAGLSVEKTTEDLGILGSELKTLIPDAVTESVSHCAVNKNYLTTPNSFKKNIFRGIRVKSTRIPLNLF